MAYTRTVKLAFPITTVSGLLKELTVSTLPAKQVREIAKKHNTDHDQTGFAALDQEFELAVAMTGQPEEIIAQLKKPDYNSLTAQIDRLTNYTTPDLLEEDENLRIAAGKKVVKAEVSKENPSLLVVVSDPLSGEVADYRLQPPTVGLTRQVRIEKDNHKRGMMVASTCTGLHQDVIDMFHMPDFNYLMELISDFLTQPGDYFQKQTLTD
ncbi:phage protein [Trabulsiella guamensis ATCC 49490]|uniref:Phage protein n=1 Tax=Trabulsiella guamensis ATCC 49490 TaxID=1005994 RepID=A0A085AFM8_9ENTR|nr:phage tail assembly protein [Trabulsiella guamensis]KFC09023.1 phage protein [Trabulsiella guamensis ATCC 49490]